jgi:hypothetical protein
MVDGMGHVAAPLILVLVFSCAVGAESVPRVRAFGARSAAMLDQGVLRSPTLAALVGALEETDVIVHIEGCQDGASLASGTTRLVAKAGGYRYLRIGIAQSVTGDAAVALLGHELYHVWEIAQARWVVDAEGVERLYESIGHVHRRGGMTSADSAAARSTGRQVQAELRGVAAGD